METTENRVPKNRQKANFFIFFWLDQAYADFSCPCVLKRDATKAKFDMSYKNEFFYEMLAYHRTVFGLSLDYTSHAISCSKCLIPALDGLRVINTNSQNFDI